MTDIINTGTKLYDIRQLTDDGDVLSEMQVEALSSEAAAKHLREVKDGTDRIEVCHNGQAMSEMAVDYWQKRVRGR